MAANNYLTALYRLEFYKKKKSWKFCQDVCKKDPDPKKTDNIETKAVEPVEITNKELNKTYNIEENLCPTDIDISILNNGFIGNDVENILPEASNIPDVDLIDVEVEKAWVDSPDGNPAVYDQDIVWDHSDSPWVWPEPGAELYHQPFQSQELNLDNQILQACPVEASVHCTNQCVTNNTVSQYSIEDWQQCSTSHWTVSYHTESFSDTNTNGRSRSLESLDSFMRGAARVPHSSELDVTVMSDEELERLAWRMSLEPEARMIRQTAAIRHLLDVAAGGHQESYHQPIYYECPTQDVGPAPPDSPFLAGTFRALLDLPGKGRGRLRPKARPGVVAIRMGRPYRIE